MNLPWDEQATLIRLSKTDGADDQEAEILFEGPLLQLARKVKAMSAVERRGLRMSLPDRRVRPHTFENEALTALIENIPNIKYEPLDVGRRVSR